MKQERTGRQSDGLAGRRGKLDGAFRRDDNRQSNKGNQLVQNKSKVGKIGEHYGDQRGVGRIANKLIGDNRGVGRKAN